MRQYSSIFNLGFRIFFFSATTFAILTMAIWLLSYGMGKQILSSTLAPVYWHGHELVFGYSMAVVAGFLLTAVQNWTGIRMPHGMSLTAIWLPWLCARVIFALIPDWQLLAEVLDMFFTVILLLVITRAVVKVKQWRQIGILSKLVLMLIANILFFCSSIGLLPMGHYWGLYLGVFVLVALVLTIGRRVTPFFIERGVGYPVTLKNSALKDNACLISFLAFFIVEVFTNNQVFASILALMAALTQAWRLSGWYSVGIWKKPLLWSLYLAFIAIIISLLLYFLRLWLPISNSLAMHGLATSGIGIITLSMIGRISLGHTGRDIHQPSLGLIIAIVLMFITYLFRVLLPVLLPGQYLVWIIHAQVTWILAFLLLLVVNIRVWFSPRPDGKEG